MKKHSLLLVISQKKANLYKMEQKGHLILEHSFSEFPWSYTHQFTDKPGRSPKRKGEGTYNLDKDHAQEANARHHFIKSVSDFLYKKCIEGVFKHLYIMADPRALGEIRQSFPASLLKMVLKEIPKNLAEESEEKILKILEKEGIPLALEEEL